jgi:hypothetical protein
MLRTTGAFLLVLFLTGCATTVSEGWGTANGIELSVSSSETRNFYLIDGRQAISSAQARGGKIAFALPTNRNIGSCLAVIDQTGKSVLPNRSLLKPSVRVEFQNATSALQAASRELDAAIAADPSSRIDAAERRLRGNRAFVAQSCERPAQRPIPARPSVRCSSERECQQEGAAICYTRYIGEKGCGKAMSDLGISGILSSPGCAAAAARLARDKYDLNDAFIDALVGAISDAGRNLRRSDDWADNLFGVLIGAGSELYQLNQAQSCTSSFVDRHYGPLKVWQRRSDEIVSEPEELLASCRQNLQSLATLRRAAEQSPSLVPAWAQRVDQLKTNIDRLRRSRQAIEWCQVG